MPLTTKNSAQFQQEGAMDETTDKVLYDWVQGDPYRAPEVRIMAAPEMSLTEFRDRHVDTSRGYLIIQAGQACDQPTRVNEECKGRRYHVTLAPIEATLAGVDMVSTAPAQSMSGMSLTSIKGIGRRYAAILHDKASIDSVQELLVIGASPEGREQIQSKTGLSSKVILRWIQLADLMRIEGIGSDYSQLLWQAGITSAPDLASKKPKSLMNKLTQIKKEQGGVHRLPYLEQVSTWIQQASKMEPVVL
jgi:predicted flap endonuclease-1-like 5' DNA nuclease